MRTLLALASFALLVGAGFGCGDDTTAATSDMAMVTKDLSAAIVDMQKLSCAQIIACVQGCSGSTSCDANCISEGSSTALPLISAFEGCLFEACGPTDGGGSGMCSSMTDTSQGCQSCLGSTGQSAALGGGPCASQFTACASN